MLLAQKDLGSIKGPGSIWNTNPDDAPTNVADIVSTIIGFLTVIAGIAFSLYLRKGTSFFKGVAEWLGIRKGSEHRY